MQPERKKKGGGEQEKSNTCYKCAAWVRQNPVRESYQLAKVESEGYYWNPFSIHVLANQTSSASMSLSSEPAIHQFSSGP